MKMKMNFNEAIECAKNCRIDDHSDWRVPSIEDLSTLASYKRNNIDLSMFNFNTSNYWSSTTHAYYPDYAWHVDFYDGYVNSYDKGGSFYVRCVRSGEYDRFGCLVSRKLSQNEELFTIKEHTIVDNRTLLEWALH